jgi:hypothetical protein
MNFTSLFDVPIGSRNSLAPKVKTELARVVLHTRHDATACADKALESFDETIARDAGRRSCRDTHSAVEATIAQRRSARGGRLVAESMRDG